MPLKTLQREAEHNKESLRWWYLKYHPDCEIAGHNAALNTPKQVVFTMTGCVTICDECYERLNVQAMYVKERPHLSGVLPALPLTPSSIEKQAELDL